MDIPTLLGYLVSFIIAMMVGIITIGAPLLAIYIMFVALTTLPTLEIAIVFGVMVMAFAVWIEIVRSMIELAAAIVAAL